MSHTTEPIPVLHVDDEPGFAEMVADYLERETDCLTVDAATNVRDGLAKLAEGDYACIVSDYDMPAQTGIEFLETVRDAHPDLPFILYTGKGSEEVASDAISAGATDYLQKERGTSQYELLANRIQNAVEQYRAAQRAVNLDRIRTLASDIDQALVRADSRHEAEERICDIISDSEPYLFAWIGEVDREAERVEPRTWAGSEAGYLDDVTITTDASATGQGPGGTAIRERRIVVAQNIAEDPQFEPWREAAIERGYRAVAAIPLIHEETLYGELVVYANRTHAFDDDERALLAELGDDIAHAFHSFAIQQDLRAERAFIEQAFDALNDVFYVVGPDGDLRRWNDELTDVTGYADEDVADMQVVDLFPEDERETVAEAIEETRATGDTIVESEFRTADGERIPYEFTGSRLTDADGDLIGVIGIGRDITERQDRLREIEALNERLQLAVEGANLGVWDWDMTTDAVEFNEQWAAMLGYTLADIEPYLDAWESRVHPDDIDEVYAALEDHVDEETPYYDTEHRMRTADGDWKWIRDIGTIAERDEDGEPVRAVGIHLDIDERKQRERELERKTAELEEVTAQLKEQYRTLFEEAPIMMAVTEQTEGTPVITDCNNRFIETLGFDEDTVVGRELKEFYTPNSRERLLDEGGYERALNGEFTREHRALLTADGETVETLLRAVPRRDESGDIVGTLAMYVDITEQEQVKRANERLEEFTRIVSHDLRNPLTVAAGRLELARQECDSEHLESVAQAHERMNALIEDLLTLAREETQLGDVERVDFATLVENCWENVATATADVRVDADQRLRADRSRLRQLLENLFRNAVEHGGEDVTVTVGALADGFYVEDDGPGIPADRRAEVVKAGYSTDDDGVGLGLSIVKNIADAHGWELRIRESDDGGARFEFTGVDVYTA